MCESIGFIREFTVSNWTQIALIGDCPPGTSLEIIHAGRVVALYNVDGQFYALDGVCPHQGGPLGKGSLSGCIVSCPWHGWQFDIKTGLNQINAHIRQPLFDVRVEQGAVFLREDQDTPA